MEPACVLGKRRAPIVNYALGAFEWDGCHFLALPSSFWAGWWGEAAGEGIFPMGHPQVVADLPVLVLFILQKSPVCQSPSQTRNPWLRSEATCLSIKETVQPEYRHNGEER